MDKIINNVKSIALLNNKSVNQFIKYGLSGAAATVVHILVFNFLAWKIFPSFDNSDFAVRMLGFSVAEVDVATRALNSIISNIIAFTCSNVIAYLLNIVWVFTPGRHHRFVEFFLFFSISALSVVIGSGLMGLLIRFYHWQTTYAFTANIITSLMINFVIRKFYIFKR